MSWGVSGAELEERVAHGDPWGIKVLHETIEQYSNLAVFDRPLTPRAMTQGYAEACDSWGAPADLIVVDYLDLVQAGDSVMGKADFVKSFGTEHDVPMIVLHQTSRSAGSRGQQMRIDSGGYGGETHATFQIGVWRKRAAITAELVEMEAKPPTQYNLDRIAELHHQLSIHQYTLSLNLNKNKRPSGRLLDTIDFEMNLETGVLTPLYGNVPEQFRQGAHLRSVQ
jgi:replicative DNA helicase